MRFLDRMRGALTAAPTSDDPVNQMPHAAPTMDKPSPNATPKDAYPYGLMCVNTSDQPALQYSLVHTAEDDIVISVCCYILRYTFLASSIDGFPMENGRRIQSGVVVPSFELPGDQSLLAVPQLVVFFFLRLNFRGCY